MINRAGEPTVSHIFFNLNLKRVKIKMVLVMLKPSNKKLQVNNEFHDKRILYRFKMFLFKSTLHMYNSYTYAHNHRDQ